MTKSQQNPASAPIYRVNKFAVPTEARDAFLDILESTHALMRRQDGFVRSLLLEQQAGPDLTHVVALHEFAGDAVAQRITAAIAVADKEAGFDRQAVVAGLGVKADMGNFRALELQPSSRQRRKSGFPQ